MTDTNEDPPCPKCGSDGYVPWDATHIIRCSNRACKLHEVKHVLTSQQWYEMQKEPSR